MENKSILFLCQYFYPEKISSGVLPFELAEYLAGKGYKINALVGYPKEYNDIKNVPTKEVINGVKIQRVRYIQSNRSNFFGRIINYIGLCLSIFFHECVKSAERGRNTVHRDYLKKSVRVLDMIRINL